MARREMETDADLLANITEALGTEKQKFREKDTPGSAEVKVTSFKEKFALNYINFELGKAALIEDLEEVVGELSFGEQDYLLIVSHKIGSVENGFDECDFDTTEDLSEGDSNEGKEDGLRFDNKVSLNSQLVVKAGPTCGSHVQFVTGKSQLQSVSCINTVQTVKTETLPPLKLKDAKYFISIFVQGITKLKARLKKEQFFEMPLPWLLIKCKAEKPQNVSWLLCKMEHSMKDGTGVLRSFVITEEHAVNDLETKLARTVAKDCMSKKKLHFARYDLLSSIYKRDGDITTDSSMLLLELSWQEKTAPCEPPPSSADSIAKFKIVPSDTSSPLAPIYMELVQLESVVHGTSDAFDAVWMDIHGISKDRKSILENLPEFLEALQTPKYAEQNATDQKETVSDDEKSPILSYVLDKLRRKDHDFTDDLWDFLKQATSMEEVILVLDHVFAAICTCEIQPVFSLENKTDLAVWVREFYKATNQTKGRDILRDRFDAVVEDKSKIFELIANLGLEKHKHDYISFFIKEELATFGQLEPILKKGISLKERMQALWKLHHCLELVSVAVAYLHLPVDYVRMILKSSLNYFANTDNLRTAPIFFVSIPAVSSAAAPILDRCMTLKPVLWKCSTKEVSKDRGFLKIFISSEDREASLDAVLGKEDIIGAFNLHKVVIASESSVRVF